MTIEPGAADAAHLRLPAGIDTLEALRLGRRLQDVAGQARDIRVDASAVEEIGLAGLQLVALVKAALARAGGGLVLVDPSSALSARIADAGMASPLLDAPAAPQNDAQPQRSLRFTDAALDYGREPAEALRRLRDAGIGVEAVLPGTLPRLGSIEADRLLIRFAIRLPNAAAEAVLAEALAEFGGDALLDAPSDGEAAIVASEPLAGGPADTQTAKIERLMGDVEELMMRHAAVAARYGSLDRDTVAELKAMGGVLRSLQDHAIAAGLVPLGSLLQRQAAIGAMAAFSFPGSDIEIEPAVLEPLLPLLAPLVARPGSAGVSAREREGLLVIEIAAATAALAGVEAAAASVRGRVSTLPGENGPLLRLELPRSRSMIEALIVRVGAQLGAVPVDRALEILRPDPADLTSVGAGSQLMRFRGTYLPLVDLADALSQGAVPGETEPTIVVVVQSDAGNFGIRVSEVTDHRQIMVKPLDGNLPSGAGVIGLSFSTGGIALVLDVDALRLATLGRARSA